MKKYRFIGNMEDVTPCGNMDKECIAVGCKGKVCNQCHFDPLLNLISSGNEYYEEIFTECEMNDTVFRVEKDGAYSKGGLYLLFSDKGKLWMEAGHLKNHFKQRTGYNSETHAPVYLYQEYPEGAEVVEYALVEVKRTPVRKFVEGGE
jgi:hypothetical protein